MTGSKKTAPYGSWKSPIKADDIASASIRLGQPFFDGENLYWLEGRPTEGGRSVIVRSTGGGSPEDVLPAPFNARTLVHEYGGGQYLVDRDRIYFVNYDDQRLYVIRNGQAPLAVTKEGAWRYADMTVDRTRDRLICVCEDHSEKGKEAENKLVAIDISKLDEPAFAPVEPEDLVRGYDFFACPRVSPDGALLTWIAWKHPNMPWDGTDLHLGSFDSKGSVPAPVVVAGGVEESIFQPSFSAGGTLYFVSDSSGWWNIRAIQKPEEAAAGKKFDVAKVTDSDAEFGMPLWVFGMSTYAFLTPEGGFDRLVSAYNDRGLWKLALVTGKSDGKYDVERLDAPYTDIGYVIGNGKEVAMLASSPTTSGALIRFDVTERDFKVVKASTSMKFDPGYISEPQVIEFPTEGGLTAYAFFYPPTNKDYAAPDSELPPLLVKSHGGPTGATSTALNLGHQYYTSRGWAVVDVNYGGSTGYGREYMKRLELNWGVVDVNDCKNAALYLVETGLVDGERLAITGGSAGGYTTLCVLTFTDSFKAGASHFGIGDVEALALETHKFESRYGDRLTGPYPEAKQTYIERSPIHYTEKLNCPVIFFQGLEDKVVPPNQAQAMVEALKNKGVPVAYIAYEGEQHGFRKAENIKRTIDGEYLFFATIFGFEPADKTEPIHIENLNASQAQRV